LNIHNVRELYPIHVYRILIKQKRLIVSHATLFSETESKIWSGETAFCSSFVGKSYPRVFDPQTEKI